MPDAVGDDFDRQTLGIADGFLASRAVSHHAGQFQCLGDPTSVIFAIELNREIHRLSVPCARTNPHATFRNKIVTRKFVTNP
jgi:hypothetical protein